MKRLLVLALAVIFPSIIALSGCFSSNNVYYDTERILSSATGYMWKLSDSDFSESTFGSISPASFSNGDMPYESWATIDITFANNWGNAEFAFLIFTVEARTAGELHVVVSVNEIQEYETTIAFVGDDSQTIMLSEFEKGTPFKLRFSNTPPIKVDEEGNEEEDEDYSGYEIEWRINNLQVVGVPND